MNICMYVRCVYVCMCVCICVCMCTCVYVSMCVCMYVCMYVCVYVCMYVSMYICMYVCVYVHICVCVYVCMYACMYVYVCMYVCIDTYTRTSSPPPSPYCNSTVSVEFFPFIFYPLDFISSPPHFLPFDTPFTSLPHSLIKPIPTKFRTIHL